MMVTYTLVQGVLGNSCKDAVPPFWLTGGSCYLSQARRCWRALCMGRVYSKPENWLELTLGVGLEMYAGDSKIIRLAALVAAVVARVLESAQHYRSAVESMDGLLEAWKGRRVMILPCEWPKELKKGAWLSPSTKVWWHCFSRWQSVYWRQVSIHSCYTAKAGLELINTLAELADALSFEPASNRRNVCEIFKNTSDAMERFVTDAPSLVALLHTQRSTVALVLNVFKAPFTADKLIEALENAVFSVTVTTDYLRPIKTRYGDEIVEVAKKGICGAAAGIGCLEYVPRTFVAKDLLGVESEAYFLPYQPIEEITRPSYLKAKSRCTYSESTPSGKDEASAKYDLFRDFTLADASATVWRKEPNVSTLTKVVQCCWSKLFGEG